MLKQSAMLEVKIGENVYQFHLPSSAPLGEAHDAIFQMRSYIVAKINEAIAADKPKEALPEEEVSESPKEE